MVLEDPDDPNQQAVSAETEPSESNPQQTDDARHELAALAMEPPALSPMGHPARKPFYARNPLTVAFCVLLILIYGVTSFKTDFQHPSDLFVALGGFYPPAVAAGEWWRLITGTLLHANPDHLFNNVVGLLIFGNLLEPVIGSRKLFVLYVLSALGGMGLSYYMLPQGMSYGASTIDYGLIGAYMALILALRYRYDRAAFFSEFRGAVTFVLLFVAWNTMESRTVNIWGHIGGLLGGIGFALWLVYSHKSRFNKQA